MSCGVLLEEEAKAEEVYLRGLLSAGMSKLIIIIGITENQSSSVIIVCLQDPSRKIRGLI